MLQSLDASCYISRMHLHAYTRSCTRDILLRRVHLHISACLCTYGHAQVRMEEDLGCEQEVCSPTRDWLPVSELVRTNDATPFLMPSDDSGMMQVATSGIIQVTQNLCPRQPNTCAPSPVVLRTVAWNRSGISPTASSDKVAI